MYSNYHSAAPTTAPPTALIASSTPGIEVATQYIQIDAHLAVHLKSYLSCACPVTFSIISPPFTNI